MKILDWLRRWLRRWPVPNQQGGGNLTLAIGAMALLLAATPFLLDLANTYHARGVSRTGADAGGMGAAEELAAALESATGPRTDGVWHESEDEAVNRAMDAAADAYVGEVYGPIASGGEGEQIARQWAKMLAERNQSELVGPSRLVSLYGRGRQLRRTYIYDLRVDVRTQRELTLYMQKLYGTRKDAPAQASAVTYLDDVHYARDDLKTRQRCIYSDKDGCQRWRTEYKAFFHVTTLWKTELIE